MPAVDNVDEGRELYDEVLRARKAQEAVNALGAGPDREDPRVTELRLHNALVYHAMKDGGSVVDALVAVCQERERLMGELIELQNHVGRRYRLPGGKILVWRPPDGELPLTDLTGLPEQEAI